MSAVTAIWDQYLNMPPPDASCRGCSALLWKHHSCGAEVWLDSSGYPVCVQVSDAEMAAAVSRGEMPAYLYHQPMPAGLRGAPAPESA